MCEQLDEDCFRKNDCSKEDYRHRNGNYFSYGNISTDSDSLKDGYHPWDDWNSMDGLRYLYQN